MFNCTEDSPVTMYKPGMVYDAADWKNFFVTWLVHTVSLGGIIVLYKES